MLCVFINYFNNKSNLKKKYSVKQLFPMNLLTKYQDPFLHNNNNMTNKIKIGIISNRIKISLIQSKFWNVKTEKVILLFKTLIKTKVYKNMQNILKFNISN